MAGRGQSGGRREPVFDSSPELRVSAAERSAPESDKPKRRRRRKKKSAKAKTRYRSLLGRITYWSLVAAFGS